MRLGEHTLGARTVAAGVDRDGRGGGLKRDRRQKGCRAEAGRARCGLG